MLNKKLYNEYNLIFQSQVGKEKIENGKFFPVIDTLYFFNKKTKITKLAIDIYNKFQNFLQVNNYSNSTEIIKDFLLDLLNKSDNEVIDTEKTSSSLTDNIKFIPFQYKNHNFIGFWFIKDSQFFKANKVLFLELKVPIKDFIDLTHKIYYVCQCSNKKELFINYQKDIKFSDNVYFKKNYFYCKKCNKKVIFII